MASRDIQYQHTKSRPQLGVSAITDINLQRSFLPQHAAVAEEKVSPVYGKLG